MLELMMLAISIFVPEPERGPGSCSHCWPGGSGD